MSPLPSLRAALSSNDEAARVVTFDDIELRLSIGANAAERLAPQRVLVSAALLIVPPEPLAADDLAAVVDYDAVHGAIRALEAGPHVVLQETLAERVARICLGPADVAAVEVHVRKPDAYPDCRAVGVRVVRTRRAP